MPEPLAPPQRVILSITSRCNLPCVMCNCRASRERPAERDAVLRLLDSLGAWLPRGANVVVTGGEPLLHPHAVEFIARLAGFGFVVELATNGSLLTPELAQQLAAAGLRNLNFSLDGIGETHDRLRNAPGLYQGVLDMIQYTTQNTPLRVSAVSIIHALSAPDLPELARVLLQNERLAGVFYQAVVPTLGMEWNDAFFDNDPLWPRDPERLGAVLAALDRLEALQRESGRVHNEPSQWEFWRRYFRDPRGFLKGQECRVGDTMLHMTAEGHLRFCHHFPPLGLAGFDDPREAWFSARAQSLRAEMRGCTRPCNYKVNCCFDLECGGGAEA